MADYALAFDGTQNYVSLGTLGNFGSNLGNGFYCSFQIKTTQISLAEFGEFGGGSTFFIIGFNETASGGNTSGALELDITAAGQRLRGGVNSSPTVIWNDGNVHAIVMTANFTTKTITIVIDGQSQTITYSNTGSLTSFSNFTQAHYIAARWFSGSAGNFLACTLDNFQIGTSSSVLYGNYGMNDGPGSTTIVDSSGNGNTGTLTGNPLPIWVTGLNAYGNVTGRFNF